MSWLARLLRWVPAEERQGIQLDLQASHWMAFSPKEYPAFLRALADLVPEGAIAYLEGGFPPETLRSFLNDKAVPELSHVAMGTICPRPEIFHVPATRENLLRLADIAEHCAEPEIAIHFHIYKDGQVLLQWYDAFADPMYISREIPEEKLREFCGKLGVKYRLNTEGVEQDAAPNG